MDFSSINNGLKVNTSKYSGDNVTSNKIYVRYNVETMKYFKAELTYSYDDSENGWAGLILGYTNYERQARWGDSLCGAEFFTQTNGLGTYSSDKLNKSGYTEGAMPSNWTSHGEHTLKIVADDAGIKFYVDGFLANNLSTKELSSKGYNPEEHEIHIVELDADLNVKVATNFMKEAFPDFDIKVTPLSINVAAHTGPGTVGIGIVKKV